MALNTRQPTISAARRPHSVGFLHTLGQTWLAEQQQRRVEAGVSTALARDPTDRTEPAYYNLMLSLFALGWVEKRYQFREDGTLKLSWETSCPRAATR
ncbi:Endo-1,4-beta-D-glucanase Y [Pseudomonas syringae pv. actinidiae]|uniref:Endo-1,4-beta-D-glucanase Y n=1 Tax=Pseudomonas syringae pv. actinidiae TaxID=103796 RepID=A0A2V0Q657_PSESF|nr:Endo-1,4-beta-D-glucanase Y [Pseudomonas syringae pv. actinidiae]